LASITFAGPAKVIVADHEIAVEFFERFRPIAKA